jgi:tRNA(His) 5'-end guanylyltransferase
MASVKFNHVCLADETLRERTLKMLPVFDCRVFQLPNRTEAVNAFLWREKDATKNIISMAARSFYPHRELDGKSSAEMQEMIFQKGQNFNDYPAFFKRGTFVRRITEERLFTPEELVRIPEKHLPSPDTRVTRSRVVELEMPVFTKVLNREAVVFEGAAPVVD